MRFESYPSPERHIAYLLALSCLYGIREKTELPPGSKVLEIACGVGSLSLAQALQFPQYSWTGIDRDVEAIAEAEARRKVLDLSQIRFLAQDFADLASEDSYEVILAHGVYSWIPREDRRELLKKIGSLLSEDGIAYVSFNAAPGWNLRGRIAGALQEALEEKEFLSEEQRVASARDWLRTRQESLQLFSDTPHVLESEEIENIRQQPDAFLLHEVLNPDSDAVSLEEFQELLAEHGLRIVSDARVSRMKSLDPYSFLAKDTHEARLEAEMHSLLGKSEAFRGILVCRQNRLPDDSIFPGRLEGMFLSSSFVPEGETPDIFSKHSEAFHAASGERISFSDPLMKSALLVMRKFWPAPIAFPELLSLATQLLGKEEAFDRDEIQSFQKELLQMYFDGFVNCTSSDLQIAADVPSTLVAFPLAQEQSKTQKWVTTLRGEYVELSGIETYVLSRLGPGKDKRTIKEELLLAVEKGELAPRDSEGKLLLKEELNEFLLEEIRFLAQGLREKALLMKKD